MREILFRGKSLDNGEWVYGYLVTKIYGSQPIIVRSASMEDDCSIDFDYVHVDPATVGQFTGTLVNGKRIFEGDICRFTRINALGWTNSRIGQVLFPFDEETPCFYILATTGDAWSFVGLSDIEVIGNIHDGGFENG